MPVGKLYGEDDGKAEGTANSPYVASEDGGIDSGGTVAFESDGTECLSGRVVTQYAKVFERENLVEKHQFSDSAKHPGDNTPYSDQRKLGSHDSGTLEPHRPPKESK